MKKILFFAGISIAAMACHNNNPSGEVKNSTDSTAGAASSATDTTSQSSDSSTRGAYQSGDTSSMKMKRDSLSRQ